MFGSKAISLIEGRNRYGSFLLVQIWLGQTNPSYIVIPERIKEFPWVRIAHLVRGVLDNLPLNPRQRTLIENNIQGIENNTDHHRDAASYSTNSGNQKHSYAHAVNKGVDQNRRTIRMLNGESQVPMIRGDLEERLETLEHKLSEIRYQMLSPAAVQSPSVLTKKNKDGRQIDMDPMARIKSQEPALFDQKDIVME